VLTPPMGEGFNDLLWDGHAGVMALRVMLMDMLVRCNSAPADLIRAWTVFVERPSSSPKRHPSSARWRRVTRHGIQHGLTRPRFLDAVQNFFADENPDLWQSEVRPAAEAAFDELLKLVPGENFMMSVGILHLHRWLTVPHEHLALATSPGKSGSLSSVGSIRERTKYVVEAKLEALERKTPDDRAKLRSRRRALAKEHERACSPKPNVDWVEKARGQIAHHCQLPPTVAVAPMERRHVLASAAHEEHALRWQQSRRILSARPASRGTSGLLSPSPPARVASGRSRSVPLDMERLAPMLPRLGTQPTVVAARLGTPLKPELIALLTSPRARSRASSPRRRRCGAKGGGKGDFVWR